MSVTTERPVCPVTQLTTGPQQHFFGYYDKCPWNASGRRLLVMDAAAGQGLPTADDVCRIRIVDAQNGKILGDAGETRAWNWQQGAMAQWWPLAPEDIVLYNDREEQQYVARIVNTATGARRTLPLPIYTVSGHGEFALSLSFARLRRARPAYGYAGLEDPWRDERYPDRDGIHWMDLRTGEHRLVLSYAQVAKFRYSPLMEGGVHTLEHLMISPDSRRFCFLHRYPLRDGGLYTRLMTAAVDGTDLHLLGEGWISHFCWKGPTEIVAWARSRRLASTLRSRGAFANPTLRWALNWVRRRRGSLVRQRLMGDGYRLFRDVEAEAAAPIGEPIGLGVLTEDGHCTVSPDGSWLLTDTYPSADRQRTLIVFELATGQRFDVGRFFSPPEFDGPLNCDLHPRWHPDGTHVCIDSAHDGSRQIYIVDVRPALQACRRPDEAA